MPSQKKSGNRGSQRESPISKKNDAFFDNYLADLRKDGVVDDVYVGRVIRNGDGRMDVFFASDGVGNIVSAVIPGRFRGKAKHSVKIEVGSIVIIADTGIRGARQYEINCLLSYDQIYALRKTTSLDARILADENDESELMKGERIDIGGFDIGGGGLSDDEGKEAGVEAELDIDRI